MTSVLCVATVFMLCKVFWIEASLEGPNICPRRETYVVELNVTEVQSYTEYEKRWCKKWPFRCQEVITKHKTIFVPRNVTRNRVVLHCCDGYVLNSLGNGCEPFCAKDCTNGTCVAPDVCKCQPGFVGETCEICLKCGSPCPQGLYGSRCEHKCLCKNNSTCNSETGECTCREGWRDLECEAPCGKGFYGLKCEQRCPDREVCDHITGRDICRPGYIGLNCGQSCPFATYGQNCTQNCTCKNKAGCDNVSGKCLCLPGWKGADCSIPCSSGTFGVNCKEKCKCSEFGMCSPTHGQCKCYPGWIGKHCMEVCVEGYYGDHCLYTCNCSNDNFICDPVEGCVCKEGYTGTNCSQNYLVTFVPTPEDKSMSSTTISFIIVSVVIVAILLGISMVLMVYFYRKRVQKLEDQIYKISYTTRSVNSFDEDHDLEGNNVGNNIYSGEKERAALLPGAYSSQLYSEQYEESLRKNRNADFGNPSIEFDFSSNKYEEMADLQPKNENLYDKLNFSRPSSSKQENYQIIKHVNSSNGT